MALDDAQRNIAGALGVGAMLGGIAWIAATFSQWHWQERVFPALGMFVVGVLVVLWAWPGQTGKRATHRRLVEDGKVLVGLPLHQKKFEMLRAWQDEAYLWLRRVHGHQVSDSFRTADATPRDVDSATKAQLAVLMQEKPRLLRRSRSVD